MAPTAIQAIGLDFAYDRSAPIIEAWSQDFRYGEMVALTGESGRGKSTLLYLIGLMVRPGKGTIAIDGSPVSALTDHQRSRFRAARFGFVFQDAALDHTRSVLDNVLEPTLYVERSRTQAKAAALELLNRFGVSGRVHGRPGQVSGGQAQRIALCRALVGDPTFLLADEPTGNLDRRSAATVVQAMREHADRGNLVIVVTHDQFVVDQCDRNIGL